MNNRIRTNQKKSVILIVLFTLLLLHSWTAKAQNFRRKEIAYKGVEASFGYRQFKINSSIAALDQLNVGHEGGRIGFIFGNDIVRANIELLGYFYSSTSMQGSIHLYENGASVNFYPLALLFDKALRIEPYLTGGLTYERMKFHGYYLLKDAGVVNYSTDEEPFVGSIHQVNAYLGAGIDFKIVDQYDFVHLFSEMKYGVVSLENTKYSAFSKTTVNNQLLISVGVRFGAKQ